MNAYKKAYYEAQDLCPPKRRASRRAAPHCSAMRPYETKRGARGHIWKRDEDGSLDIFAYNLSEYCNGPRCVKCGYGFCHHCHKMPEKSCTSNVTAHRTDGAAGGNDHE